MSINLLVIFSRKIYVVKTKKYRTEKKAYDVFQTPTSATRDILASSDPLETYFKWVVSVYDPETAHEHITRVRSDLRYAKSEGYEIEFSSQAIIRLVS
jgi:hypothetical protein